MSTEAKALTEADPITTPQISAAPVTKKLGPLHTEHGDTLIADQVVQKIAGMACREVPGIFAMGSAARRVFTDLTSRIPGSQQNVSGGVTIEKGERQATIDVSVIIDYGVSIVEVSESLRANVINAVEYATGLEVLEVNIHVTDVHLPEDETGEPIVGTTPTQESARLE